MPSQKEGEGTGKGEVPIATDLEGLYFVVRTRTQGQWNSTHTHACESSRIKQCILAKQNQATQVF